MGLRNPEGVAGFELDQPVDALAGGVGDAGEDERLILGHHASMVACCPAA